jgi:TPR repeat protein
MNIKKRILLISFTFLFLFSIISRIFFNDFQDGWDAYVKKDYKTAHDLWLPLAEQGSSKAQFFLGFMYDFGFGVEQEDSEAMKWYRLAAEQGNSRAQFFVGLMYANGQGVSKDNQEAMKWYRLAAEQGYDEVNIINLAKKNVPEALKILTTDAENGVAEAQYSLGAMYANGEGVPQDDQEAMKWYRLAAEQGHSEAKINIKVKANIYELAKKNVPEALKIMIRDAEKGIAEAQYNLGGMYANGEGVPQDDQEAFKWYRLAVEQGYGKANIYELAKKNVPEALKIMIRDAEKGIAEAQYNLGVMHQYGLAVRQDDREAMKWYRLAAENGYKNTIIYDLANKSVPEALEILTRDAENGVVAAQVNLGVVYANGQGVPQDEQKAFKWYRLAAEQEIAPEKIIIEKTFTKKNVPETLKNLSRDAENGVARAQINLGVMYQYGLVAPEDHKEALKWYRLAAEQGDAKAQLFMGLIYTNGQGIAKNSKEAMKWYGLAAEQRMASKKMMIYDLAKKNAPEALKVLTRDAEKGIAVAQYNLGAMYANGEGVPQDFVLAHMWYNLSGLQGHKDVTNQINLVEKKMSPQQIEQAQEMVRDWKPQK